ncbi:MAG: type VI secretion protein IcmF/TssM N-terminal domain-containing protein [Gemmataceae bacterium]
MNLYNLYWTITEWIRRIAGIIFPLFRRATDFASWGRWAWHVLHAIVLGFILWFLWYLGNKVEPIREWLDLMLRTNAPAWVRSTSSPGGTGMFLPLLFLLVYALSWVLRWIWLQLGPEAEIDEFPDMTTAWADGVARLATKGIRPADLPLYLVLGRTKAGEEFLFRAGQVPIEVIGPTSGAPPVRLWASRDAIYVTCPEASALGTFADLLYHGSSDDFAPGTTDAAKKTVGLGDDDSLDANVQEINALRALQKTRDLTPEERARMRELAMAANQKPQKTRASLKVEQIEASTARLRYLGKLIARARRPFCPVNGVLALVSWEAIESDEPVKSAALALRSDLLAVRNSMKLCSPVVALVCDMEQARGFSEFRSGFNTEQLAARIGQRFPMVPDQPILEQPMLFESGANWLGERLFPGRVYHALPLDLKDRRTTAARNLFHLFRAAQERMPRLARLLRSGLPLPTGTADGLDGPLLFAGCYLAGTGREQFDQAFVPGVFERLSENQGYVAWTQGAVTDDANYRRYATTGYAIVAIGLAVLAVLSFVLFRAGKT